MDGWHRGMIEDDLTEGESRRLRTSMTLRIALTSGRAVLRLNCVRFIKNL